MKTTTPQTLLEAVGYFSDEARCVEFLAKIRWDMGQPVCPKCGSMKCVPLKTRKLYNCCEKECGKQFSVKSGSIFEKSPIPLTKWLPVVWMLVCDRNGVSSYEIARALGVSQQTSWFMLHRIREGLQSGLVGKLSGQVEIDETFVGGKSVHMSPARRQKAGINTGRATSNKTVVMGIVERGGVVVAKVVNNTRRRSLIREIEKTVEEGSNVYTDALKSYDTLRFKYNHSTVDHKYAFVQGEAHTNTLENFWSLLKRSLKGTYVQVAPFHLDRYVTEQAFRYNNRKKSDAERFVKALSQMFGKRLTYEELTGATTA
ncbi:MAG TPA: IS1595 family transposase [Candidatus Kapabacteria bacterium]|nr:IS1595 family transposase [Candidatus Kapabacteria bacterium]